MSNLGARTLPYGLVTQRALVLCAAVLFSTGGAAIKATSLTAWQVASFRSGVAAVALLVALPGSRRFWEPRAVLVGAAYAATMILFVSGNKLTTAANTIFLQSTAPLYVLLLGPWLLGEPIRRRDVAFLALMAAGLGLFFVGVEPAQVTAPRPFAGNLLGAASGVTWAATLLGLRWLGREARSGARSAVSAVVAGNLIACLACLPLALPVDRAAPADLWIVLYLGVIQIGLAYACLTRGVQGLPALEVSLLLLLEPVLNAVWAWAIHGERIGPFALAGCAILLAAMLGRTLARRR